VAYSKKYITMKYGYARVSSDSQDYSGQVEALKATGCERIWSEKASGKSTNGRPQPATLMRAILPGDDAVGFATLLKAAQHRPFRFEPQRGTRA
jgi:DNA invertase Pin-like site-specific DNA recombinase